MFVCVCNCLPERQIRGRIDEGAATVADVFESFGCTPKCALCLTEIESLLGRQSVLPDPTASCK
jgi:bacterioferritin-associated ferredoxin